MNKNLANDNQIFTKNVADGQAKGTNRRVSHIFGFSGKDLKGKRTMKTLIKNFVNEISQITWISGRQLAIDTAYVLIFTSILLVYFTLVDGVLGETIKNFVANR